MSGHHAGAGLIHISCGKTGRVQLSIGAARRARSDACLRSNRSLAVKSRPTCHHRFSTTITVSTPAEFSR